MGTEIWTKLIVIAAGAVVAAGYAWQYFMKPMREQQQYSARRDEMKKKFREYCGFDEPSDDAVSLNTGGVGETRQKLVEDYVRDTLKQYQDRMDEASRELAHFVAEGNRSISDPVERLRRHDELMQNDREQRRKHADVLGVFNYFGYLKTDAKAKVTNIKAA